MPQENNNGNGNIFSLHRYPLNNAVAPVIGSANEFSEGRSRTAGLRKKIEHDRKYIIGLFVICIFLAIIVIAMAASYIITKNSIVPVGRICQSEQCIRSAANLRLAMNTSVNPCEDFYRFTCDRWTSEHPDHGWFSQNSAFGIIEEKVTFAALKFFQSNATSKEPLPVKQSRDMYKGCMDLEARNKLGYAPIFKYLSMVGLPAIPAFMNMTEEVDYKNYKYDWIKTEAALTKVLDLQLFIGFAIEPNVFNTSQNCIVLGVPSMESPLPSPLKLSKHHNRFIKYDKLFKDLYLAKKDPDEDDSDDDDVEILTAYKKFMLFVIKTVIKENTTDIPDDFDQRLELTVDVIAKMQLEISSLLPENDTTSDYNVAIPVNKLQAATNDLLKSLKFPETDIWKPYLQQLFQGVNVTLDLDNKDLVYVSPDQIQYLLMISGFLTGMPDVLIEVWVWWMTVNALIINTTSEIKEYFDKLAAPFQTMVLRSRAVNCAILVNTYMGMAVSYAIADKSFLNETRPKLQQMLGDIKDAFAMRVNELNWMDAATKRATLEKSDEMISFIGYPDWFMEDGSLEEYYSNVTIHADSHLENMIQIIKIYIIGTLESLHKTNDRNWHSDPTTVNAFNYFLDNSITIPMAISFFPLFNLGLEALNYGAIGSILGHELTHGFDNTGRKYDKYGNYRQWWSNSTIEKFENLTTCFVKQYSDFYVPEVDKHIDGQLTLGENIADNGGLHHAFSGYKNYQRRKGKEPLLPGLEKFSHEQLFFIAFGSIWCDEANVDVLKYQVQDEHCPNKYRVLGSLMNTKEFTDAFKCPKGSKMNPNKGKCKIW